MNKQDANKIYYLGKTEWNLLMRKQNIMIDIYNSINELSSQLIQLMIEWISWTREVKKLNRTKKEVQIMGISVMWQIKKIQ
jgi:hypothetical protein